MQLNVLKDDLAAGLAIVGRAVTARSTLPVLHNICLTTEGSRLRLSATNLERALTCWVGAQVTEEGAITLPAKTLLDTVNAIAFGESLEVSIKDKTLFLKAAGSKTQIKGMEAEEFPVIPYGPTWGEPQIIVAATVLRKAIEQTTFSAATDEARPTLTGVLLRTHSGQATLAATDGFRAAEAVIAASVTGNDRKAVVPASALDTLKNVLGKETQDVKIYFAPQDGQVVFAFDNVELLTQLIEGEFPDYEHILPAQAAITATVNVGEMRAAIRAVNVFAREDAHTVKFTFDDAGLTLLGQSAETGQAVARMATDVSGLTESFQIAFNAKYLLDVFAALTTDRCQLRFNTPTSPSLFVPVEAAGGYRAVIMPLRVGN